MYFNCGINTIISTKRGNKLVEKKVPVKNTVLRQHVEHEEVQRLLDSCTDASEFERRVFHIVVRRCKREGIFNIFPKEAIGVREYWEAYSPHAVLSDDEFDTWADSDNMTACADLFEHHPS